MFNDLKDMKIAVIGAGISGVSVAKLARLKGAQVFVSDAKKIPEETKNVFAELGINWEENGNSLKIFEADEVVVSSGIPPHSDVVKKAGELGISLVGELDFAYPFLKGKIISVTGSNGKTTTTSIIAELLEKNGYKVAAAGNIGLGAAQLADKEYDYIVLELSSFQLYWTHRFKCIAGIITNIAPDHINWHGTYENYISAKANLFNCVQSNGVAICQKRDTELLKVKKDLTLCTLDWSPESEIFMDKKSNVAYLDCVKLFDFSDIKLLGTHNLENVAMSLAALKKLGLSVQRKQLNDLKAPRHRCEYAGEINGITFVNDSKGTNVAASITAMSALPGKKVMIFGGQGKGEDYNPLAEAAKKYATSAVLIGEEKNKIANALTHNGFQNFEFAANMKQAVEKAYSLASCGECVLLSPACTSWDMYSHFEERGEDFCRCVAELAAIRKNG